VDRMYLAACISVSVHSFNYMKCSNGKVNISDCRTKQSAKARSSGYASEKN